MSKPLKYLFECHFADGTVISQTPEDVSANTPGKNAFYDVLQRMDEVVLFGLISDDHAYAVDLQTGWFQANHADFAVPNDLPEGEHKFRLVYFRRNFQTVAVGGELPEELSHIVEYHIGWQTTIDGKNYQQTIKVV